MRHTLAYVLATSFMTLSLTGCELYFGGGGGDDCLYGGGGDMGGAPAPVPGLRNPNTGQCEYYGGGGGDVRCDACGICEPLPADPVMPPTWGFCESECSYLDEAACLATPGCRGAYLEGFAFYECWAVDMSGPIQGGQCAGLDALECSRHDDCVAVHASDCTSPSDPGGLVCGNGEFVMCAAEPGADPGQCYGEVLCDSLPPACPPDSVAGIRDGCWTGSCISVTACEPPPCAMLQSEQECVSRIECDALYEGSNCTCDAAGNCTCETWTYTGCTPADPAAP